eukprot:832398-Alexandrium_andersonii.AAC.1
MPSGDRAGRGVGRAHAPHRLLVLGLASLTRAEGTPGPRRAVGCSTRAAGAAGCRGRPDAGSHCPPAAMAVARALPNSAGYAAAAL